MKKVIHCDFLNHGLHFTPDIFRCCCAPKHGICLNLKDINMEDAFGIFQKMRAEAIENMKKMIVPENCKGCIYLKEYDLENENTPKNVLDNYYNNKSLINYIIINHFKHCDCNCTYCSQGHYLKKVTDSQKSEYYDLLPVIKDFYAENLIDKENLTVEFQGGSIAVLNEFDDLVDIFLKNNAKKIFFYTNGLKYMPSIVKTAQQTEVLIICSVDAGTPETFKKLKPAGDFKDVINNLTIYSQKCLKEVPKDYGSSINAKYILIEGVNDSIEEIEKFLEAIANAGVNMCQLDMDFRNVMMKPGIHYDVPKHYFKLFEFFNNKAKELNLRPFVWEYIQNVLDKGFFE